VYLFNFVSYLGDQKVVA